MSINLTSLHTTIPRKVVLFLCVYLFIFSPRFDFGVEIHTGYVVVLFALIYGWRTLVADKSVRAIVPFAGIFSILAVFHFVMASVYSNNPIYFASIQISLVIYLLFGFTLSYIFTERWNFGHLKNECFVDEIILLSALSIFLNSLIILTCYVNPTFKLSLESLLVNDLAANIDYANHPFRLRGFASAGGAALSVINSIGVLLFIFLARDSILSYSTALILALPIVVSNVFTGRTGMIAGSAFYCILLILSFRRFFVPHRRRERFYVGGALVSVGLLIYNVFHYELDPESANWAFDWVEGLLVGRLDSSSIEELSSTLSLPDNPVHLLLGIGFFEGEISLYPRSDSGYLKTIFSVGLIFAVLMYVVLVWLFTRLCIVSVKYYWLVCLILFYMLLIEIKEPFLYQNFSARLLFLLSSVALFANKKKVSRW